MEIGVVGSEEDGITGEINNKLYTTADDFERTVDALSDRDQGRVPTRHLRQRARRHKPGHVQLRPEILQMGQEVAAHKLGLPAGSKPLDLVFHGGSGAELAKIHQAVSYRVVKMNL